jgi:hypothetical protein
MENSGRADVVVKDSSGDGREKKAPAGAAAQIVDSTKANYEEDDFAEVFPSELPSMVMLSAPSGSPLNANYGRDVAYGRLGWTDKLEHAQPSEPMPPSGLRMFDSLERPPAVFESNQTVAPGAFPTPSSLSMVTTQTLGPPMSSYEREGLSTEDSLYTVEAERVPDGNEDGPMMVAEAHYVEVKWYQRPMYRWIWVGSIFLACGLVVAVVVLVVVVNRPQSAATSISVSPTPVPPSLAPELNACNFLSVPDLTECRSKVKFESYDAVDKTSGSTIPSEIGLLTQLTYFSLKYEGLSSTIPSEIGLLNQLTLLDLSFNSFNSTIPSEIGLLTNLMSLSFWVNSLTSTIPSEIGLLTQLRGLWFYRNELKGTIPSKIGLLTQLTLLDMSYNALTSTIPTEFGLLKDMTYLDISMNELTSTIPSEIGLLTKLSYLSFIRNQFTSSIPPSLCSLPFLNQIAIDCSEITCDSGCCYDSSTGRFCG